MIGDLLLAAGGVAVVLLVLADVVATVLAPERRGLLTAPAGRLTWMGVVAFSRGPVSLYGIAGTLAILASLAVWFAGLWAGFTLILLAGEGAVAPASQGGAAEAGEVLRAMYLSGTALTTVGFGDLVAASEVGLLIVVFAAGAGLAVVTAAISYVLSVYPLISEKRAAAARAADLGADRPDGCAELVVGADQSGLSALHNDLTRVEQDLRRFPVLFYFHASRREEQLTTLLRAASLAVVHLEWTLDSEELGGKRLYAPALRAAADRLVQGLQAGFAVPSVDAPATDELDEIFAALASSAPGGPPARGAPEDLREFVGRSESFLRAFAKVHGYRYAGLGSAPEGVEGDSAGGSAGSEPSL